MNYETTPAIYLVKLLEVLEELSLPTADLLRNADLAAEELGGREQNVALSKYLNVIEAAAAQFNIPDLGFLVGEHTKPLEHGVLGYALLSAPTLRESLKRYVRYQYLQGPLLSVRFAQYGNSAYLEATPIPGRWKIVPATHRYIVQEWLVGWNQWCQDIGVSGVLFDRVRIGYRETEPADFYVEHLGCPVSFGHESTQAWFPARHLDRPLEYADEAIAALCAVQCERLLEVLNLGHGLVAEIHRQLANIPGKAPTMDDMAERLRIGTRTLRRRLMSEGTNYKAVVTEFRIAMARRYLKETSLPANEIANLIGFSDAANLYRMFQRQLGLTPQQYRQQQIKTG